jgi:hypothetical protein
MLLDEMLGPVAAFELATEIADDDAFDDNANHWYCPAVCMLRRIHVTLYATQMAIVFPIHQWIDRTHVTCNGHFALEPYMFMIAIFTETFRRTIKA